MRTKKRVLLSWFLGLLALTLLVSTSIRTVPLHADIAELEVVNQAIKAKGAKWRAQENEISRLSKEERKKRLGLLGVMPPEEIAATSTEGSTAALLDTVPSTLDWRRFNGVSYVTPVKNQGSCGSCWAFATAAALESQILLGANVAGTATDTAEQVLVSCSGAGSCSGGYIGKASDYLRDLGLPAESCFPYVAKDSSCSNACADYQTLTSSIIGWRYTTSGSPTVEAIKQALAAYGPLVATMSVYSDFYYYSGGVYSYTSGTLQGGHAVLIVGYDDPGQYFIVKNSWGTNWGEGGFFRIAYGELDGPVYFGRYTIAYEGWRGDSDNSGDNQTCNYSLSATALTFPADGGTGQVQVNTAAACGWSAQSQADWITLTAGMSGQGSGTADFQVAPNPGRFTRTGSLTVAGQTVSITQKGRRNAKSTR